MFTSLRSGRNVYHRIASAEVAGVLEALASLSPRDHLHRAKDRRLPEADTLRARSCYNHIAGRLGVLITARLIALDVLELEGEVVSMGSEGATFFHRVGIGIPLLNNIKKPIIKLCLDWTERKHHISGPLATAFMDKSLEMKWLERRVGSRALVITAFGYEVRVSDLLCNCDLVHAS